MTSTRQDLSAINPEMVRLAREARGLTQADLAIGMGVTQSKVSKIEAALLLTKADLDSLCNVLDRPASFFFWPDRVYGFASQEMFHRKRKSAPSKTLSMVHAEINIRRMQVGRLLRSVDLGGPSFPQIDPDEYDEDIEAVAMAVRAAWRLPNGPIRNVVSMIEDAGAIVLPHHFGTQKIDAVSQWVPGLPPLLFVNVEMSADRTRYTLSHECGHLIMHRIIGLDAEREADAFAAELLMPAQDIRHQLTDLTLEKLAQLKQCWKVSMGALRVRAETLQTISPRQARRMWMLMGKLGYRKHEPIEIEGEQPSLYLELFAVHRQDLNFELSDLGEFLGEARPDAFWEQRGGHLTVVA